jgi:hypothetical protein
MHLVPLHLGDGELKPPGTHVKHRFEDKTFLVEEWWGGRCTLTPPDP